MPHQAEILAVGTELLLGNIANTNAQFLSELLASVGIDVLYHTAVGDNPRRLRQAVEIARGRCDLLVFTGGLGPTYDDMTKETVAEAFGLALEYHPEVMEEIQCYFDNVFHRPMPACNRQQAMLPQGCTVLHNPVGTAPGCIFTADGVTAVLLPGVPHECRYLAEHALLPWLQGCSGGVICSHDLRVFGLTEPRVQELLGDLMDRAENPSLAPYAKPGEVMLRLTAKGESPQDCQERMAPLFWDVRSRLGDCLYGVDVSSLEEVVITRLRQKGLTLSAAESCTGGLIAKRLTDVPGASAAFLGGVVSYTNAVKALWCWWCCFWCSSCLPARSTLHQRSAPAHRPVSGRSTSRILPAPTKWSSRFIPVRMKSIRTFRKCFPACAVSDGSARTIPPTPTNFRWIPSP